MTDNETGSLGGYGPANRTFWLKGLDLTVARLWEREPFIDIDMVDRISTSIRGRAISEDGVCVIGQRDEVKEFELTLRADTHAKQKWERIRKDEEVLVKNDATTIALRLRALQFERLNENPPTASLGVYRPDWEIGGEGGWWIECCVPSAVLAQLEADLLAQRAHELHMGIKWEVGLIRNVHAPPSVSVSWDFSRFQELLGPDALRGYVSSI